jgi:cobalt/nickel transport system permease protein
MHIPDNFLSTPVWVALDAISIPAAGLMVRRAGREMEDRRIPLMGVMGAFVFAAQMINFPGAGRRRKQTIFAGAFLSVLVSASLALSELLISGIAMPRPVLMLSLGLFVISALIEGAITVSVVGAIEKLNPGFVQKAKASNTRVLVMLSGAAVILGVTGFVLASSAPDGIQKLALQLGLTAKSGFHGPFADYAIGYFDSPWLRRATAGLAGLLVIYGICAAVGKMIARQRSA